MASVLRSLRPLAGLALLATTAGCDVDTDAAVFVEASIDSASAAVEVVTLGASLSGAFDLKLHLGPRASDAAKVTLGAFAIESADRTKVALSPLEAAADRTFPVTVDVDSDVTVHFTFDTGDAELLTDDEVAALCAGPLVISGTIQDSLQEGATPAVSSPFQTSGCP
jgi:hypothetical protein